MNECAIYRDILDDNMLPRALDFGLGEAALFQQDNDPKHKAKMTKKRLWHSSANVLKQPSQREGTCLKMTVEPLKLHQVE